MTVKLIAITKPVEIDLNAEGLISYIARVSNPKNQNNQDTANKLLKYMIKNNHWSPFEMVHVVIEIICSRAIGRQILRHRSFSFQEFCITGDSKITTLQPNGAPHYIEIKKLYDRRNWKNYQNLRVRIYDEKIQKFIGVPIKEVFYTGKKPCFKFILEDGKVLKSTKEEKVYSHDGFIPIENLVGLKMIGDRAVLTKEAYIGTNGIPLHQSYEWLSEQRNIFPKKSLGEIADSCNITTHTIRKWLKKHHLQYSKKEVAEYTPIWNKGIFGYKTTLKHSEEHIQAIKLARSGANSNWWRGGVDRNERSKIADWCQTIRNRKLHESNFSCKYCGEHNKLELDHIIPVWKDMTLAYKYENIQVLCHDCHVLKHDKQERKIWRQKHQGNTLVPKFVKVVSVEYIGEIDTYDLEVDHVSHNYIANKIMVHNSQRYAEVNNEMFEIVECRKQDLKNRQNSITLEPENNSLIIDWWKEEQKTCITETINRYNEAISKGIAKEQARVLLPEGLTMTKMYMAGTLRSWIHYCLLRMANGTQKEHQQIAKNCWEIITQNFPSLKIDDGTMLGIIP